MSLAGLNDVRLLSLAARKSDAGYLVAIEGERTIPFSIARTFYIGDVPVGEVRGRHAHYRCNQLLVCPAGSCTVTCHDGARHSDFLLERPDRGLVVPATIWAEQRYCAAGTVLIVLADRLFEADDYIRDWQVFLKFRGMR